MNKICAFFILLLILSVFSCDKTKFKNQSFSFGELGNKWVFEEMFWYDGDSSTIRIDTIVYEIISSEKDFVYKYTKCRGNQCDTFNWYISNRKFGKISNKGDLTILAYKNSKEGDILKEEVSIWENHRILSTNEKVIYKNDTINCFLVKDCEVCDDNGKKYYISKQYGIIKEKYWYIDPISHSYINRLIDKNF